MFDGFEGSESPFGMLGDLWSIANGGRKAVFGEEQGDALEGMGDMAKGTFGLVADGASSFGEAAGPLGGAFGGVVDMGTGIYDMVQNSDQIDQGGFFNDEGGRNEFWGGAGDATLGAMHTAINAGALLGPEALPFVEGLDLALSVGEGAVNAVGTGTGLVGDGLDLVTGSDHDWWFGAGDVVGGAEHAAVSTGMSTLDTLQNGGPGAAMAGAGGAALGGGLGLGLSTMTLGMASPLIPMLAAGGGALGASLYDQGIMGTADAVAGWF